MHDRAADRLDPDGIARAFGDEGRELVEGIADLRAAVESWRVGYVSFVATTGE